MPLPTGSDVHVDSILTNISVAYQQSEPCVADQVFPLVSVQKQSDKYFIYSLADFNRSMMEKRAPGTESAGAGWRVATDNYFCDVYALHKDVDDQTRANTDRPLDCDRDAVIFLQDQNKLKRDIEFATDWFTTSKWTGTTTGSDITPGTLWSAANSTPVKDIRAQRRSIRLKTGRMPNTVVMGGEVWDALCDNADIRDRIKYTQRDVVTEEIVAQLLQVKRVIVADTMKVTSGEGASTTTTAAVFGKHLLLCFVPDRPGLNVPAAGYTFEWNGLFGLVGGQRITRFRMEHLKSDRVEIETHFDQKQIGADLGAFFASCVS